MRSLLLPFGLAFATALAPWRVAAGAEAFPVTLHIHAAQPRGEWTPIWRFFGYDEADYTYLPNGKRLLSELGALQPPQIYIRCHHLLTSGDGAYALKFSSTSAYKEDAAGRPVYDWTLNDKIFDTCRQRGLRPYVEIGFMPEALSTHPQDYPHHPPENERVDPTLGMAYPPKDYARWGELVYQWTKHCVERYGADEVGRWYWEVWNEPNIGYWHGSREDYFKLYDYAVDGVRRALPDARVGGPETAGGPGGTFLHDFLEHCARGTNYVTGRIGAPLDFISFHAKGTTRFIDGHVRMSMISEFRNVAEACDVIASFPEFKKLPVIISECDPEGCAACTGPAEGYRNGSMYASYTAACFSRLSDLAAARGVHLEGALTWAFEFEGQPPFAGFRALATDGIDKPVLNVFRMFSKMSGEQLAVEGGTGYDAEKILRGGVRGAPDVSALAVLGKNQLTALVWHYYDDDVPGPDAEVTVTFDGLPRANGRLTLTQYRIDANHSNAWTVWKKMGSPVTLTAAQRARLEQAGQLARLGRPEKIRLRDGQADFHFLLPRQAVSLLVLEWR